MFKNLTVFKFNPHQSEATEDVFILSCGPTDLMSETPPRDPTNLELMTQGWLPVPKLALQMVTASLLIKERFLPLTMVIRQRAIDNAAVKLAVKRAVDLIQKEQNRAVGRKERLEITEDILIDMIPRAPIKEKMVCGYFCGNGYILIDAVGKAAEDYMSFLRTSLGGSLACERVTVKETAFHNYSLKTIKDEYVEWDEIEAAFEFGGSFSFLDGTRVEQITIQNCNSSTMQGDFMSRIEGGYITWCDFDNKEVSFRLMSDLSIKKLNFEDMDFEESEADSQDGYNVARHRLEIKTYIALVEKILAEIVAVVGDDDDE